MPLVIPDLIIESIIRDGLENARRRPEVIDDVFGNLTRAFASKKYGASEIEKIKNLMVNKEVAVVHAFHMVEANAPCISIQLMSDIEDTQKAYLADFIGVTDVSYEDPADSVIVEGVTIEAYDPITGKVSINDSTNLSNVYANLLLVDSNGEEFPILGGIVNDAGAKTVYIAKNAEIAVGTGAEIKTSINFQRYMSRSNTAKVQLLLGIHTKDPLTTKYLYTLVNYFLLSRKKDLITRDFQLATYSGSDFQRNMQYRGDAVFDRFLTVSGMVQHDWRSDLVELVDSVNVSVKVEADEFGNSALNLENLTVKTTKE